jgi:hypothetical protein
MDDDVTELAALVPASDEQWWPALPTTDVSGLDRLPW